MTKERNSNVELLKLLAMFLIIISHVTQTFGSSHLNILGDYFININHATRNIQFLIIMIIRSFGALGNDIFFIASAYFLIDSRKAKKEKIIQIIFDVFLVAVIFLIIFLLLKVDISNKNIVYSLFPNILQTNWYITCYLFLYSIHKYLNIVIDKMSQKELLFFNIFTLIIYMIICLADESLLYNTRLVRFIVLYFDVAYMKKYLGNFMSNKLLNIKILVICLLLFVFSIICMNFIGLKIDFLSNRVLHLAKGHNPLIVLASISIFNIFKSKNYLNKTINQLSSLTLLIYIIHENVLIRSYFRPYVFVFIRDNFGYSYIILWIILFALLLLLLSILIAFLYQLSVQKITKRISLKIANFYDNYSNKLFCKFELLK